ncbi:hypothetical protein PVK06_040324 [Gossypium arboreum]|uniref:Uncharacterized protein n=1 Tax=Gossypium arboreum TaxID=29729 RepID=A0ABR0N7Y4_GOSAR|nr:hypothetical protein PVK06_040324 [Gossypium arboreum]
MVRCVPSFLGRIKVIRAFTIPSMAGDGLSTHLQKEVNVMQQEISKIQEELVQLDTKMDIKFQEFKDEFKRDLQTLLGQYFGSPNAGVTGKRKGVMRGAPPGFAPKDFVAPIPGQVPAALSTLPFVDMSNVHL